MVVGEEETMKQIFPKKEKLKQVSLYEAAELHEVHKEEIVVLVPQDDWTYERQTLDEFLEDCIFFVAE